MKKNKIYYNSENLEAYINLGIENKKEKGLFEPTSYHILVHKKSYDKLMEDISINTVTVLGILSEEFIIDHILVSTHIDMGTTRTWSTTKKMAIGNKIKLLENEIVSLTMLRDSMR